VVGSFGSLVYLSESHTAPLLPFGTPFAAGRKEVLSAVRRESHQTNASPIKALHTNRRPSSCFRMLGTSRVLESLPALVAGGGRFALGGDDLHASMKSCGYCGREDDEKAVFCLECGTPFPDNSANLAAASRRFTGARRMPSAVAGGVGVVSICTGLVLATRRIYPPIYLFGLFLVPWLFVLAVVASALALYAATFCCRIQWHRVIFTFAVIAGLALEWWLLGELVLGESGAAGRGSPAVVYSGSAFLIVVGALTLARIARRKHLDQPPGAQGVAPNGGPPRRSAFRKSWRGRHR